MNLVNRYLKAVATGLPRGRRDDILAELRANILAQFEDREQALGRPLNEDEQAAVLRAHGNPTVVAGRYREHSLGLAFGRQLIGPELFPFFRTVLIVNLIGAAAVLAGTITLAGPDRAGALGRILPAIAAEFAIVTGVFAILDRYKGRLWDNWEPRKLPAIDAPEDGPNALSIFNFAALALGTLWLALTPQWPFLMLGPGALYLRAAPLKLMPQWAGFYWAIVALLCAEVALRAFGLFRLLPVHRARIAGLTLKIAGLCIGFLLLLRAPNFVSSPNRDLADWANWTFLVSLLVALAINLGGLVRASRSLRGERARTPLPQRYE